MSTTFPDSFSFEVSEDAVDENAQFIVLVNGTQFGGVQTVTASHAAGDWQTFSIGNFIPVGTVQLEYLNGGNVTDGQNLYVKNLTITDSGGFVHPPFNTEINDSVSAVYPATAAVNTAADGQETLDPNAAVMSVNGSLTFQTSAADIPVRDQTVAIYVSEDAFGPNDNNPFQGSLLTDAAMTITIDGKVFGGTGQAPFLAQASHSLGQQGVVTEIDGNWGPDGPHEVSISFTNDAYGGTSTQDRNLYVQSIIVTNQDVTHVFSGNIADNNAANGHAADDPTAAVMDVNGTATFDVGASSSSSLDSLGVFVTEDAFNGDAQFAVLIDGVQVGPVRTATGPNSPSTQTQDFVFSGDFSGSSHTVAIEFFNDAYGGSSTADRNLYVHGIVFNGTFYDVHSAMNDAGNGSSVAGAMFINGTLTFNNVADTNPSSSTVSSDSTLVLHVSEDAFQGDAQFIVSVDGTQVGGVQTATASHGAAQVQDITLTGNFGAQGPGKIDITFLNDAYGGTSATDRNLYVESLDINSVHFAGNTAANNAANGAQTADLTAAVMDVNGTAEFNIAHTAPVEIMG
jgi:hypothetical protein